MKEQLNSALSAQATKDNDSNYQSFILDSGAKPSFVRSNVGSPQKVTRPRQVTTPNGSFQSKRVTTIMLKTPAKKIRSEALVHDKFPRNLLSLTPILKHVGAVILNRTGAAFIPHKIHTELKPKLKYFAVRRNGLYQIETKSGGNMPRSTTNAASRSQVPQYKPAKPGGE